MTTLSNSEIALNICKNLLPTIAFIVGFSAMARYNKTRHVKPPEVVQTIRFIDEETVLIGDSTNRIHWDWKHPVHGQFRLVDSELMKTNAP